ncbi:MAG: MBOAT family protein [Clostridia bacterium]|nr:MBOAT family protein [Clostridia bacterium]
MSMTSLPFLAFAAVTVLLYYLLPRRVQWVVLLLASAVFYAAAGGWYLPFILVTIASTYALGRVIAAHAARDEAYMAAHKTDLPKEARKAYKAAGRRKRFGLLVLGLVFNFGILGVLKYTGFTLSLVNDLLGLFNAPLVRIPSLILPLGISFYTFRSTAYLIDVYRGKCTPERNLAKYALFVAFFPAVIQGPICRFSDLSHQFFTPHAPRWDDMAPGFLRLLWGFFKKLVVADTLMVAVKAIVGRPEAFGGMYVLLLIVLYSAVIYGDFTGGIDITLGLSRMLGLRLSENFDHPFSSRSTAEYWNRWHITMGSYFTDYVFYPLSICRPMQALTKWCRGHLGRVVGMRVPVYLATLFTWFLTGLWHGASWNFIVWGLANGVVILISRELEPLYARFRARAPRVSASRSWATVACVRTFFLMGAIRILDCYRDVPVTFRALGTMFMDLGSWGDIGRGVVLERLGLTLPAVLVVLAATVLIFFVSRAGKETPVADRVATRPVLYAAACGGLTLVTLLVGCWGIGFDAGAFIYGIF